MSNSNPSLASGKIETHWLLVHNPQLVLFGELNSTQLGLASPQKSGTTKNNNNNKTNKQKVIDMALRRERPLGRPSQ